MSSFEKVHAVVARSTLPSQNVKNTRGSDHFWRLRCRVSKQCTPLWREAHFEVKMYKTPGFRSTFGGSDVASLHSTAPHYTIRRCTTLHDTTLHNTIGNYNYSRLHSTTLNYTTLHSTRKKLKVRHSISKICLKTSGLLLHTRRRQRMQTIE